MLYGMYLSAAGLATSQYRMEVLSNNLANTETAGFKHDLAVVRERRAASAERMAGPDASAAALAGMTGGSLVTPTVTSFEQGPIEETGNPLDVAIEGEGFFRVQTAAGERYSRDGRFTVNDAGELVTVAGFHPVLDGQGSTIVIPREAQGQVRVDANGKVVAGDTAYGTLGLVRVDDPAKLRKEGSNLLAPLGAEVANVQADLKVRSVEKSNVDAMRSMVSMIEVSRAYQFNATMMSLADGTLSRAVNDVGRIR